MKILTAAILLSVCVGCLGAGAPAPADLERPFKAIAEKYKLPGMVGAIAEGDRIVALGSTGVRKAGEKPAFRATDVIHLGSDTKAMTAVLIGQLIDQKKLAFDTTMAEAFPDLAEKMNAAMAKVTVRQLLNHNAGFPHDLKWAAIAETKKDLPAQRRQAVNEALSAAPAVPIGRFAYSNVSYVVLGAIVEEKTGKAWEDVMREKIFKPLGMETAGFGPPGTPGAVDQPWGHILENGKLKPLQSDNPEVMAPAGRAHCSMEDWSKFIIETLHAAQGKPTLLSAATFKELTTPFAGQDYAGGWIVASRDWAGGTALTHAGSNGMWCCDAWIAPTKNRCYLDATNFGGTGADDAMDEGIAQLIDFGRQLKPEK